MDVNTLQVLFKYIGRNIVFVLVLVGTILLKTHRNLFQRSTKTLLSQPSDRLNNSYPISYDILYRA